MKLERGRLEAGFMAFNHGDYGMEDFRIARAWATKKDYFANAVDSIYFFEFNMDRNRDKDVFESNNVVSQALAKAMQ